MFFCFQQYTNVCVCACVMWASIWLCLYTHALYMGACMRSSENNLGCCFSGALCSMHNAHWVFFFWGSVCHWPGALQADWVGMADLPCFLSSGITSMFIYIPWFCMSLGDWPQKLISCNKHFTKWAICLVLKHTLKQRFKNGILRARKRYTQT